jgi:hypothetical protein
MWILTTADTRKLRGKYVWDDQVEEEHICMQEFTRRLLRTNDRRATFASDLWDFLKDASISLSTLRAAYGIWLCDERLEPFIRTRARLSSFEWRLHGVTMPDDFDTRSLADSAVARLKVRAKHPSLAPWSSPFMLPSLPRYGEHV